MPAAWRYFGAVRLLWGSGEFFGRPFWPSRWKRCLPAGFLFFDAHVTEFRRSKQCHTHCFGLLLRRAQNDDCFHLVVALADDTVARHGRTLRARERATVSHLCGLGPHPGARLSPVFSASLRFAQRQVKVVRWCARSSAIQETELRVVVLRGAETSGRPGDCSCSRGIRRTFGQMKK